MDIEPDEKPSVQLLRCLCGDGGGLTHSLTHSLFVLPTVDWLLLTSTSDSWREFVRWSLVVVRCSLVVGRWSLVVGRWSLVVGRWTAVVFLEQADIPYTTRNTEVGGPHSQNLWTEHKLCGEILLVL